MLWGWELHDELAQVFQGNPGLWVQCCHERLEKEPFKRAQKLSGEAQPLSKKAAETFPQFFGEKQQQTSHLSGGYNDVSAQGGVSELRRNKQVQFNSKRRVRGHSVADPAGQGSVGTV